MTPSKTTTTLTEEQVFLKALKKDESYYRELRDKLLESGTLLDKHRKTAKAAQTEAATVANEWKGALRASGGDISKSVRDLKRKEIAARETAEEFAALVAEMEPDFHDLQTVVCQARSNYLYTFERVDRINISTRLEKTAEAVFSTDSGQELLTLLLHQAAQVEADCATDPLVQEGAAVAPQASGISVDEFEKEATTRRVHQFVYQFIERHGNQVGGINGDHFQGEPIPAGPYELSEKESNSRKAALATARLKSTGALS